MVNRSRVGLSHKYFHDRWDSEQIFSTDILFYIHEGTVFRGKRSDTRNPAVTCSGCWAAVGSGIPSWRCLSNLDLWASSGERLITIVKPNWTPVTIWQRCWGGVTGHVKCIVMSETEVCVWDKEGGLTAASACVEFRMELPSSVTPPPSKSTHRQRSWGDRKGTTDLRLSPAT